jgi:hypothetical protein
MRQRSAIEPLFHFALALLAAGAPRLEGVIVAAVALAIVGSMRLNLSIGDPSGKRGDDVYLPKQFRCASMQGCVLCKQSLF